MEIRLLLDSEKQGRETPLSLGVYLVGRSSSCQIRPKSKSVSRKHCAIIHKSDVVLLQDIGSKHGTFVNDKRLEQGVAVELADGDRIRAGRVRFRIAIAEIQPVPNEQDAKQEKKSKHSSAAKRAAEPAVAASRSSADPIRGENHVPPLEESVATPDSKVPDLAAADASSDDQPAHVIDDIMNLIEGDASDIENSAINIATGFDSVVDLEESDGDEVEFAAPRSNESLSADEPVPAYDLQHAWDVNGVQNLVSKRNAPPTIPTKKFKPKSATKAQKAEERQRQRKIRQINGEPERNAPAWLEWMESGIAGPIVIGLVGIALLGWVAYNVYLLYSFDG